MLEEYRGAGRGAETRHFAVKAQGRRAGKGSASRRHAANGGILPPYLLAEPPLADVEFEHPPIAGPVRLQTDPSHFIGGYS